MIITYTCNKENGISIQPKEIRSEAISICEELLEIKAEEIQEKYFNEISNILKNYSLEDSVRIKNNLKAKIKFNCVLFKIKAVINEQYIKEDNKFFRIQKIVELNSPVSFKKINFNFYDFSLLNLKNLFYNNCNVKYTFNKTFSGKIKYGDAFNTKLIDALSSYCFASCYLRKEEVSFK